MDPKSYRNELARILTDIDQQIAKAADIAADAGPGGSHPSLTLPIEGMEPIPK